MAKTIDELSDDFNHIDRQLSKVEMQIGELSAGLKIMSNSMAQLNESVKKITDLIQSQIKLTSEIEHIKKDFVAHEKDSEKTLIRIEKDLDVLHKKARDSEERFHTLELHLQENTTARRIGQWVAGLIFSAFVTWIIWKLK